MPIVVANKVIGPTGTRPGQQSQAEQHMQKVLAILALGALAACGGGALSGDIGRACMSAGREAASPALCTCIQQVANQSLSSSDQGRAAAFFDNPDKAQQTRQSDAPRDEDFWDRYRAFADRAEAVCG